jgi:hypothetical protein
MLNDLNAATTPCQLNRILFLPERPRKLEILSPAWVAALQHGVIMQNMCETSNIQEIR